jgi:hypothetical protein
VNNQQYGSPWSMGRHQTGKISVGGFLGNVFGITTFFYVFMTLPLSYVFMPAVGQLHQSSDGWVETTRLYQLWHLIVWAFYTYLVVAICMMLWCAAQTIVMDVQFGSESDYIAWRRGGGQPFIDCICSPFNDDSDDVRRATPHWAWEGLQPQ